MLSIVLLIGASLMVLSLVLDLLQTTWIARNPTLVYEMNKILGKHPSVTAVRWYFATVIVIFLVVVFALYWWSFILAAIIFSYGIAFFEGVVVWRNHTLNIPIST